MMFFGVRIMFVLVYKADPEKMRNLWHFILVFTVCQSTCSPVSRMKMAEKPSFSLPYFPRKLKKKIAVCKILSSLTVYFLIIRWLLMNPAVHVETFHSGYW